MCYNGKCMHCIDVETGSLIYAIFNIIGTSVGLLFTLGAMVYVNVMVAVAVDAEVGHDSARLSLLAAMPINVALGILLCLIAIPFAFTIVLIKGLVQKKPGHVKVYFVYAVICKMLLLVGAVVGIVAGQFEVDHAITIAAACSIYALILRMLYMTYKKLEVDTQYDSKRLVEHMKY